MASVPNLHPSLHGGNADRVLGVGVGIIGAGERHVRAICGEYITGFCAAAE